MEPVEVMRGRKNWAYVYHLVDPRNGKVFYVGSGTGNRVLAHEKEARRALDTRKCRRIREIWAAGHQVERRLVALFRRLDADRAFELEQVHIRQFGMANLTNGSSKHPA